MRPRYHPIQAMFFHTFFLICMAIAAGMPTRGDRIPPDVRPSHWASGAVTRALQSGILRQQSDGQFHGDAKVTRAEVVIALARLGRALEAGTWKGNAHSVPLPDSVSTVWEKTDWKRQPVRRYTLAVLLVRMGDYVANGLPRPAAGAAVAKSEVLEEPPIPAAAKTSPAYDSLVYLAHNHMIHRGSVLLKPDSSPVRGDEMSHALAELTIGVTDRLTDLGKDATGSTPDESFHKPKPPQP